MQQVRLLSAILLEPTQQLLFNFQKRYLITTDSSDSEEETHKLGIVAKLHSGNPVERKKRRARVLQALDAYFRKGSRSKLD